MSNVNGPLRRLLFVHYLPGHSPFVTWSTFSVAATEAARGLTKRQIAALGPPRSSNRRVVHSGCSEICAPRFPGELLSHPKPDEFCFRLRSHSRLPRRGIVFCAGSMKSQTQERYANVDAVWRKGDRESGRDGKGGKTPRESVDPVVEPELGYRNASRIASAAAAFGREIMIGQHMQ
jgi:hypothetical protein